ncbi:MULTISPECIES: potassium channel family protein [Cytobacillus]|uniref:Two pore domain potassium channel family protein n=1 Tax=Cytobacillus stercorigallinarum TaxID=2762240 RepID=A0ABR8QT09_9BACI|nr:potassium channel family protein [Cytobacillus stercorigallinarum]MBD7938664.1 two pore domain potassium channel family protein [Cytobacillus stercorigallinarum]
MISLVITIGRLLSAIYRAMKEPVFKSLLTTLLFILLSGTMFYRQIEGWSWIDSFYYAFVSLIPSSVNTGLVPDTTISKCFTILYLVVGVGVMLMLLVTIGRAVIKFEKREEQKR